MRSSALAAITSLLTLVSSTPLRPRQFLQDFLLVTTTAPDACANSSTLANVSATTLFDPYDQATYLLRTIGPGYNSLPRFSLLQATLHTLAEGPEATGPYVYNSTAVATGGELSFAAAEEGKGRLGLQAGYLLEVAGETKGWTICDGPLGESVIVWKGNGTTCVPTYVQAVQTAPY